MTVQNPKTSQETPDTKSRQRLGLLVGGALAVAIIGGGGWWAWSASQHRADPRTLTEVMPDFAARRGAAAIDGVRRRDDSNYSARAGDVTLNVRKDKQGAWQFFFDSQALDLVSPEDAATLTARFRLVQDAAFAKSLKITPEQIAALKKIPSGSQLQVGDADLAKVRTLFDSYLSASDKSAPENALIYNLRNVGGNSREATRKSLQDRAASIRGILSPEQIEPFRPK